MSLFFSQIFFETKQGFQCPLCQCNMNYVVFQLFYFRFLRSEIFHFFEKGHSIFQTFFWDRTRFYAFPDCCAPKYRPFTRPRPPNPRSDNESAIFVDFRWATNAKWSPSSEPVKKIGGKDVDQEINTPEREKNPRNSGPTPVARGGSGAKAPPLAARRIFLPTLFTWQA